VLLLLLLLLLYDPERVLRATTKEPRGSGAERRDDCCPVRVDQTTLDDPLILVSNLGLEMKGLTFSTQLMPLSPHPSRLMASSRILKADEQQERANTDS